MTALRLDVWLCRCAIRALHVSGFALVASAVWGQGLSSLSDEVSTQASSTDRASGKRGFSIVPSIAVDELWTNNVRPQVGAKQSDFVTTISPGVRISGDGNRLRGYLDYSLQQNFYSKNSENNETRNSLNSLATLEAIERFAYIDFNGVISQQSISAFGQQTDNNTSINSNRTEVSTFRISPYIRGQFSDFADYRVKYSKTATRSKSNLGSDNDLQDFSGSLSGVNRSRLIAWNADLSRQTSDYSLGRSSESDRLRATLIFNLTPSAKFGVIGGRERNNYESAEKKGHNTSGITADWAPSERTKLSVMAENRFFGRSHNVSFEHRTALTAWRFTDNKDVSASQNQLGLGSLGPLYDLIFSQFASIEPDPIKRAQLVQSFLQTNGLNGATNVNVGFLTSGVSLLRRQDLSFTLLGVRDTISLIATQSRTSRLLEIPTTVDDLGNSSFVQQRGFSLSYSHRLTPETNLNVLASQMHSFGDQGSQNSTLKSVNLSISTRLGLKTTATLGARRVIFDGTVVPYTETAVLGGLRVQF